jgi:hypothetical protein
MQAQQRQPQRPMAPGVIAPMPTGAQGQPLHSVDELRATTMVERPDGTRIITVADEGGRLVRRVRRDPNGREDRRH